MIELTEINIYRVRNFAKHQNIKVKETIKSKDEEVKNKEIVVKEALKNEIYDNEDKEFENKISQNEAEVVKIDDIGNLEITSSSINKVDNMSEGKTNNKLKDNIPILLETKRNKTINKKKEKGKIFDLTEEEDVQDNDIATFQDYDEKRPLGKGETLVASWTF